MIGAIEAVRGFGVKIILVPLAILGAGIPASAEETQSGVTWDCVINDPGFEGGSAAFQIRSNTIIFNDKRRVWMPGEGTFRSAFKDQDQSYSPINLPPLEAKGSAMDGAQNVAWLMIGERLLILREMPVPDGAGLEGEGLQILLQHMRQFEFPEGKCTMPEPRSPE
jgi:hypothetical protein